MTDMAPSKSPQSKSDLFRQQAIDYHFKEPESSGVISARPRRTWLVSATAVTLVAATVVYVVVADGVVRALFDRLLR
ncbi:MAG TPA: hypothetical protein VIT67_09915 [Povalibacter sp.]